VDYMGKIKFLTLLLFCLITQMLTAQNDAVFGWVKPLGGSSGDDEGSSITTDINGNVLSTGFFAALDGGSAELDLGDTTIHLISSGSCDIFIHKLDPDGNLIWIRQFGAAAADQGLSVTTDVSGNVYVTGCFGATVDFDPGPPSANLTAEGADAFILKLDSAGNFIWVKQLEGDGLQKGLSIRIDSIGNILTSGVFASTTDFDPGPALTTLTAISIDAFVLKLDSFGNFMWIRQIGGVGDETARSITSDTDGNVYATGSKNDLSDMFIQKFDANGDLLWAHDIATTSSGYSNSITMDPNGDVYITGIFYGNADFDPGTETTILSSNSSDIFILKLDSGGHFIWVKQIGSQGGEAGTSMTTDADGNLYITGWFQNTVDFDPDAGIANLTCTSNGEMFILKLTSHGDFVSVKHIVSSFSCTALSIATDQHNNIYTTGFYRETTDFDPGVGTANHTSFSIHTGGDAFSLKINYCGTVSIMDTTACGSYTWTNGTTYTSSGTYRQTLINGAGCDSLLILYLTIKNTVDAAVTLTNFATLSANTNMGTFQWFDCSNGYSAIPGETGSNFTATYNGSYAVSVTANGCGDTSQCLVIDEILELSSSETANGIQIAPNPTDGIVTLYSDHALNDCKIYLYTPSSELIKVYILNEITSSDLIIEGSAGIYFLKIDSNAVSHTYRVCKLN
jgi:hypothetical protein